MKKYLPTIICVAVLSMGQLSKLLPDIITPLLLPFAVLILEVNAIQVFIVKHLPHGPWRVESHFILSAPNFFGWLIASIIILAPVFAFNYFLVVRKQYISAWTLSIILLLGLLLASVVGFWMIEFQTNPLSKSLL